MGLATAHYCQQHGHAVTVIERQPLVRNGCSFGNAGMIVPSHIIPLAAPGMIRLGLRMMCRPDSPFHIQPRWSWELLRWVWQFWRASRPASVDRAAPLLRDLHLASRACFADWESTRQSEFGLQRTGLLMLCRTPHAWEHESRIADRAERLGIAAEVLDATGTVRCEPNITMDVLGSVYYPGDCYLSPERLMQALHQEVTTHRATFLWESAVCGFEVEDGRVRGVRIASTSPPSAMTSFVEGDEFVICGGVWSTALGKDLRLPLPMQAGKGYSVTLGDPPQLPGTCSILTEARVAVTPMGKSLRFAGTMELAGTDASVNRRRIQAMTRAVEKYFPAFLPHHFSGVPPWVGLRPCAPDGLPYLGRTCRYANVVVCTGHGMLGISLAMISGKVAAQLISAEPLPPWDWSLLSPDRFGARHIPA